MSTKQALFTDSVPNKLLTILQSTNTYFQLKEMHGIIANNEIDRHRLLSHLKSMDYPFITTESRGEDGSTQAGTGVCGGY